MPQLPSLMIRNEGGRGLVVETACHDGLYEAVMGSLASCGCGVGSRANSWQQQQQVGFNFHCFNFQVQIQQFLSQVATGRAWNRLVPPPSPNMANELDEVEVLRNHILNFKISVRLLFLERSRLDSDTEAARGIRTERRTERSFDIES